MRTANGSRAAGCSACGGERLERLHRSCPDRRHWLPGTYDVVRCATCGLGQTVPQPDAASLPALYPDAYVSFASGAHGARGRLGSLLRASLRLPYQLRYGTVASAPAADENRVLDVGCGAGVFLAELAAAGWNVWGIEPSPDAAAAALARLSVPHERIFVGGVEEADFADGSFDLVTMNHVLEHLVDPAQTLTNIHRWLAPGGRLRIRVPNLGSLESRVFGRLWFGLDVPRHLYHFSRKSLRIMLEGAGFASVRAVPEFQGSSLSGSVSHLVDAVLRRRRDYRHSPAVYHAVLPVASLLVAAGSAASLDVTARRM